MNYSGWSDLTDWARWNAAGHETVGVGIRPYGLHAGNMAALVAYPYLAFEKYQKAKEEPARFRFQVWLNDMEPVKYVGADGRRKSANDANMYPGGKTFQFEPGPQGFSGSLVDYWQPLIENVVRGTIGVRFPKVKLEFHRASEKLVKKPEFTEAVAHALVEPDSIKRVIQGYAKNKVVGDEGVIWPLCPECNKPVMGAKAKRVLGENGDHSWVVSGSHGHFLRHSFSKRVDELAWGMQFRVLQAIRLASEKPDLWFIGYDHLPTNQSYMMEDLANVLGVREHTGDFLHVPLLFADGSKKISKSLGNAVHMPLGELINALRNNRNPGLNVKNAPIFDDLIAVGADFLPKHMAKDLSARKARHEKEKTAYEGDNGRRRWAFERDNARDRTLNQNVAGILGVPHL